MKMTKWLPFLFLLSLAPVAHGLQSYTAWCEVGNTKANISGSTSSNTLQASYPKCTVTVFLVGTTTKAVLFSDNIPTPLSNPFTAAQNGSFTFYAPDGNYDVTVSGGLGPNPSGGTGFPIPVTTPNIHLGGGGGGGGITVFSAGNLPPLFTTSVTNPTTTPTLNFALSNAGGAQFFGNFTGSTGPPKFYNLVAGANITISADTSNVTISAAGGSSNCGSLAGDPTSTNCGTGNLAGNTANHVSTFGFTNVIGNNQSNNQVAVGANNITQDMGLDNVAIGNTNLNNSVAQDSGQSGQNVAIGQQNADNYYGSTAVCIGLQNCSNGGNTAALQNYLFDTVGIGAGSAVNLGLGGFSNIGIGKNAVQNGPGYTGEMLEMICMGDQACFNPFFTATQTADDIIAFGDGTATGFGDGSFDIVAIGDGADKQCFHAPCTPLPLPATTHGVIALGSPAASFNAGSNIVAIGQSAMGANTAGAGLGIFNSGDYNTAVGGYGTLVANTTGVNNTAIGSFAGSDGWNGLVGFANSNKTGSNNTWIGYDAGPNTPSQLSNTVALGFQSHNTASNQIVLGNSSMTQAFLFGTGDGCLSSTGGLVTGSGGACGGGGGGSAFSAITGSTNTTANMVVGSGAQISLTGSGTVAATSVGGITITGTPSVGFVPTATSSSAATWQAASTTPAFSAITSGTNTGAVMLVGTGASLAPTGSGTIASTTAVALASLPTACGAGQYATGVDTGGNAICVALPTQPASQYIAPQAMSGCGVEYVSGLTYTIGACTYSINGVIYHSPLTNITLSSANPTNPRLDVIYVDTTQVVQTLTGVPAVTPQQPVVDPSTQLQLTFVLVPAAATTPADTTLVDIYLEGVEWTGAKGGTNGSRVNLTSTSNPYTGTHDVEFGVGGTVAPTTFAGFTVPSAGTVNLSNYNTLTLYARNKAAWPTTGSVTVQWFNGTTAKGTAVVISNGAFGFNATTNTTTYQQISIPTPTFGLAGVPVTSVRFTVSGTGALLTGFYLDQITLQGGSGGPSLPATLMNFKGPWSSTATYSPNDTVTSGSIGYVALATNTSVPVTTSTTWAPLGGSGGGGGVSSFAAPTGGWPSWLVPVVTNPTTTPSLAVTAGTVPIANGGTGTTTPSLAAGSGILVTGSWPNQTVTATGGGGGGGNTTSTSLTNNFLPKANGVNSIIDSKWSDDGTTTTYHGSGSVGSLSLVEGTAATGVASSDIIYADSAAHRWKMNNNAGGAFFLPGVSAAGTSGHAVAFAPNGIDLVDGGSAAGASNPATCAINSATDLCVTLSPYNASTDGLTTTTTSGTFSVGTSGTITSCSTFSASQGIYIAGAGAAGANYIGTVVSCTAGALVVTPATSTSVAGGTVVQHDESAAIQAAITALATTGGTIYFPDGRYLVNGAKQDTGGANAILKLPNATYGSTAPVAISLKGFNLPAIDAASTGAIIQTSLASGNLIGGYNNVGTFAPITSYWLDIENLTFRGYSNPGFTAINATTVAAAHLNHVWCDIGSSSTDPSNAASACVRMPELTNNVSNTLDDVTAIGYYTGFVLTEHTQVGSMYAATCHDAFLFDTGTNAGAPGTYVGNSISVDYLWSISCHHGVSGGSNLTSVNIQNADIELPIDFAIYDPSNKLMGTINYTNPYTNQYTITTSGAANVHLNNIPYPTLAFSGTGTNGALNFYRNSHTADSSISNPTAGELQANVESTSGTSFQVQGTSTSAIFNTRTSCSTCYAEFSAGTFPNWVENMYFPSGWTQGGFYDIPNAAVMVAGTGATAGILLDTRATAPLKFATHDTLALTIDGSTQAATFVAGVTAPNVTDSALTSGNCVQAGTSGLLTTIASPCNTTPLNFNWTFNSGAAATDASPRFLVAHTGTIATCYALTTASDGATALTFNIFKNGSTIFSGGAQTITAGTAAGTLTTLGSLGTTSYANNDKISINITSGTSSWIFTVACK